MRCLIAILFMLLSACAVSAVPDEAALKMGVLAYRPKPQALAQWQLVAAHLEKTLGRRVELTVYNHAELADAAAQRVVDVIATTPNHFILLQHTTGVSAALATLLTREGEHELSGYGGVIVARAERHDIRELADLAGKRIAATSRDAFGSYQMQAAEMVAAGIRLPAEDRWIFVGQPNDNVIETVLSGRADAGFVRTGVIEAMVREGKLDLRRLKVINRQNFPAYPDVVSTPLFPEWPVAVMPQVDENTASRVAAALFLLSRREVSGIAGFTTPANYAGVENLMRHLRLPPFDQAPDISLRDLWRRYAASIVALGGLLLLLAAASTGLIILYRRSRQSLHALARQAEKEKLILTSLAEGVYGVDAEGKCIFINPRALSMLGYAEGEVLGRNVHCLFHKCKEDDSVYPVTACPVSHTLRDGCKREAEDCFLRREGGSLPVSLSVSAMQQGETVVGAVVVFQDITERKQSEEDLRNYKDQLEETVQRRTAELMLARDAAEAANKAKSGFLANMSHELRTPLNAILGFSSMMKREPQLTAVQHENIDIINRSGAHLLSLINDVLEIAKIEAGRLQLEIASFDLTAMVRDVADMMRQRASEKGLQLLLEMSPEVPRHIKGDEARLRQILINLVGNAVKFTRQGGVTIRIGMHKNERNLLLIEVEDSGPGVGAEDQQRIFRPFVQLAEGGEQKGTGLGLAITKQFVDLMGGSIDLESTVGKGSLFRAELPVEPAEIMELSESRNDAQREIVGLAAGQAACRVLIVEDQHENQQLLNWLMTDIGIETRLAENGAASIEEFQAWHPDLIWMDRRMPVMDGEEATRRIRKLPGGDKVKIVAVTASAFKEEQQQMLDAGMDDFVRKPYRPDEIYACLAKHLNVRYRYESGNGEQAEPAALTKEMLAGLPAVLRQELKEAVISLDSERIAAAVAKAAEVDGELGRSLTRLVGDFDYPAILTALAACEMA